MNKKQKAALGVTLGIVALLLLFPPWSARVRIPPSCDSKISLGYAFILSAPTETEIQDSDKWQRQACPVTAGPELVDAKVSIDYRWWISPILIVLGLGLTATWAFAESTTVPEALQGDKPREIRCLKCANVVPPEESICPVCQNQVRSPQ